MVVHYDTAGADKIMYSFIIKEIREFNELCVFIL